MMVRDWLDDFLYRLSVSYPPHDWPEGGTDEWRVFVEDWVSVLARNQVSEAEADAARVALLETPPRFKPEYIEKVIGAVKAIRAAVAAGASAVVSAPAIVPDGRTVEAARGCPECTREPGRNLPPAPTGWARRQASWDGEVPFVMTVELFCRCPLGRWRKAHDVELLRGERVRQHDDLQARPELWEMEEAHSSWSWKSCTHDLVMPPGTEGKWHYLSPGEVAPAGIDPAALAAQIARPKAQARRPDLGRVEPAVPLPEKPAPREVPEPEPDIETTEKALEWI